MAIATKLGRLATNLRGSYLFSHMVFYLYDFARSRDKLKHIPTTIIPMVDKLGRVVVYNEELPLIKLHDPSITCFLRSCDKLNILYIDVHLTNGHQSWQGGDIL